MKCDKCGKFITTGYVYYNRILDGIYAVAIINIYCKECKV